ATLARQYRMPDIAEQARAAHRAALG
ncbi:MAG: hypothetical protein JWP07_4408, partial [Pseudonocardiales bacterium]|nr:hypothetical protein [Pseudonocardiales bacterium]